MTILQMVTITLSKGETYFIEKKVCNNIIYNIVIVV